jgi:Protein of unknown function (DUF2380)
MAELENARRRPLKRLIRGCAWLLVGLAAASWWASVGHAGSVGKPVLAVLPFEIEDTSGEVGPNNHDAMLTSLTRFVREDLAAAGSYDVVDGARVEQAVAAKDPGTYLRACNGCELDIAKSVGADRVMIGWLFKMSTLVMSLHVVVKDVSTGGIVYAKTFDFRGDNETAWKRAADYMVAALSKSDSTN